MEEGGGEGAPRAAPSVVMRRSVSDLAKVTWETCHVNLLAPCYPPPPAHTHSSMPQGTCVYLHTPPP